MKTIKRIMLIICMMFAILGAISVILLIVGYRPIISDTAYPDWGASGSVADWTGVLAAIAIPIVLLALEKRMKDRDEKLLGELSDFKNEYEGKLKILSNLINADGNIDLSPFSELREKLLNELDVSSGEESYNIDDREKKLAEIAGKVGDDNVR